MVNSSTKIADTAAVVSTLGAVTSWIADALPIVQFIAGVIAIITGCFAIVYHYKKIKALNADDRN